MKALIGFLSNKNREDNMKRVQKQPLQYFGYDDLVSLKKKSRICDTIQVQYFFITRSARSQFLRSLLLVRFFVDRIRP